MASEPAQGPTPLVPASRFVRIRSLFTRRRATDSAKALWLWIKASGVVFDEINGTVWASSFSYYAFFALVPMVLLFVTLGTDFTARFVGEEGAKERVFNYVVTNVPLGAQGRELLGTTLQGVMHSRGKLGLIALVGLLWSSLGFFQSLVSAVNQAFAQKPLNWWKLPLKNLTMLGVLTSVLLIGNVVPIILKTLQGYLSFSKVWVPLLFTVTGYVVSAAVLFYGFLLFYKLAPRRRTAVTFSGVWVPALIVTALLQLAQQLFVIYSTRFTDFNAVYGAFGGVIALMLWTYLSGMIVVFGGCMCAVQHRPPQAAVTAPAGGIAPPPA